VRLVPREPGVGRGSGGLRSAWGSGVLAGDGIGAGQEDVLMPANWTADLLLLVGTAWFALGALIIIERARHDRWLRQVACLRDRLIDASDSSLGQTAAGVSA